MAMLKRILGAEKKEDKEKRIWKGDDVKVQFKALLSYYKDLTPEDRKKWNLEDRNHRKVFGLCRSALEEYSRATGSHSKPPNWADVKHPCQILLCLQYLCEDNPELIASKRNLHAWTDLIKQFLDNRTNPTIRLEGLKLLFIIIDGTRERCPRDYLHLLRHSPDFTPFCEKGRYDKYLRNFKSDMIVAHDPLPWTRHGKATKAHCLEMILSLMNFSFLSTDFNFWYAYFAEHLFPQFYHLCSFEHAALVDAEFGPGSRDDYKTSDVEMYGFGSCTPPEKLQRLMADFLVRILSDKRSADIACNSELRLRYLLEICRRTPDLSMDNADVYFKLFRNFEKWSLGVDLPAEFDSKIQEYWTLVFSSIFHRLFDEINVGTSHLKAKVRVTGYVIYLFRLNMCEPYVDWTPATWRAMCKSLMSGVKKAYTSDCKHTDIITHVIYPLIFAYLKCLVHMTLKQPAVANEMFELFATEINTWLGFRPFVVVWREFVRNLTIGLLEMLKRENTPKTDESDDEPPSSSRTADEEKKDAEESAV